jgi:hypothetical protein
LTKEHLTFICFSNHTKNKGIDQTRNKITMEMSICQAEKGFSLDESVKKLAVAFENKAFADILKINLQLRQELVMHRIFNNSNSQKCCPDGHLTLNGGFERRIRSSPGEFKMDFRRIRCSKCGKNRMNNIKTVYKCQSVGGLLAKQNELCRQCCRQHWKL